MILSSPYTGFLAMFMWARWEHRNSAKWGMWITFLVTFAGLFASFVLGAKAIYDSTSWVAPFHVCVLGKNPKPLAGVWISTLTFDLITGILLIINALDQPYRQRSQVLERVRRDGALCFIVITGESVGSAGSFVMLVVGFAGGTNGTFEAAFLVWSCDAIVVSWLSLEVGVHELEQDDEYDDNEVLPGAYELGVRKGGNL
ncbi:hypothetical protein EIP86_009079 [Pleurotus ostreatoroseus]|nr:hypothetical protein EIP86_009079 [Pleurotus ostreatoroseus]